ncbi:error-prone repair protein UmuD [Acetobacter orientalis]|uniref:Error-prone repair protein UmuD n=1 Tax=Acetobacter orientalis TaxID=146474 RepID=A0A2Z5ZDU1_9PROT|nr:error-prone repair protein UmuD [Acetobacter orientalis]
MLIVDTSVQAKSGDLVIASAGGAAVLAELKANKGHWWLVSGDNSHAPIRVDPTQDVEIWAAVTGVVREKP